MSGCLLQGYYIIDNARKYELPPLPLRDRSTLRSSSGTQSARFDCGIDPQIGAIVSSDLHGSLV